MVTSRGKITKACRGQARILEAVIASAIIFLVFSAAFYLIYSSENLFAQETIDLNRLGYNVLHQIAESHTIEKTIEADPENGDESLKIAVQELLPTGIYFNLTLYNCTGNPADPYSGEPLTVSNAPSDVFAGSWEVASASIMYTSRQGNIYYIVIELTRG